MWRSARSRSSASICRSTATASPPAVSGAAAEATYGAADGRIDMAAFADLLAVHELGHLLYEQVAFRFSRRWLMVFYANLCMHSYLAV